jgi:hypothetical protein
MRLTWRDATTTLLAAVAVLVALAVTNAWGWPLLGDYRAGTVALTLVGFGMCTSGTAMAKARWSDPFVVIATLLGVAALALVVAGLIYATQPLFVALAVDIVALWFVSTVRHVVEEQPSFPAHPAVS